MADLKRLSPKGSHAKCLLLGEFDPDKERIIRDPYYVRELFTVFFLKFQTKITFCRMMAQKDLKSAMSNVSDVVQVFLNLII